MSRRRFSASAKRLGRTQPTVACHVVALGAALSSDLFVRSQRGLAPTELALALRPHAEIMRSTVAALLRTASRAAGTEAGTVRISASEVIGVEYLQPVLPQLRRKHPQLVIELALTDRMYDLILRRANIAVRNTERTQGALVA